MEKTRSTALWILSAAIFSLALALGYFAWEVRQFLTGFPEILTQMEKTSVVIGPVTRDIAETTANIDPIAEKVEHVAEFIPAVLEELRATREDLPDLLRRTTELMKQIDQTTQALPTVLEEIRASREVIAEAAETIRQVEARIPAIIEESEHIRNDLPMAVQSLDKASDVVAGFTKELGEVRTVLPGVLEEVKQTREALPKMLDQAERITAQGGKFGADAGKGVVTGLISLLNPINLTMQLKDLVLPGKDIRGLTAEDIDKIRETTLNIVESGEAGTVLDWNNPASRNQGKVSVIRRFTEDAVDCKEIRTEIWIQGDKSHDFKAVFCRQPDGAWIKK